MSYPMEPLAHFAQHDRTRQHRQDAYDEAHASLMQEVIDALTTDPARLVSAPAWPHEGFGGVPITQVVDDYLAGPNAEARRQRMLRFLMRATRSKDTAERLEAMALIADIAREHADLHADEVAE